MNTCPAKAGVAAAAAAVTARNARSTGRAGSTGSEGSARKPRTAVLLITTTSEARIGSDVRPTLQGPTTADLHRRIARPPHTPAWTCPAPAPAPRLTTPAARGKSPPAGGRSRARRLPRAGPQGRARPGPL